MPRITQFVARYLYPMITRLVRRDDVVFLNYGYEEDPPMRLPLVASDEPDRYPIQLYHRAATQVDLGGKRVLEVSCGHGGGASYLTRTMQPASYTGVDLNPAGVNFCRKRHNVPGLDFVQSNAETLCARLKPTKGRIRCRLGYGGPQGYAGSSLAPGPSPYCSPNDAR
jgi:SAM-dependent methyltransferase